MNPRPVSVNAERSPKQRWDVVDAGKKKCGWQGINSRCKQGKTKEQGKGRGRGLHSCIWWTIFEIRPRVFDDSNLRDLYKTAQASWSGPIRVGWACTSTPRADGGRSFGTLEANNGMGTASDAAGNSPLRWTVGCGARLLAEIKLQARRKGGGGRI
jgi:hypothetical protein